MAQIIFTIVCFFGGITLYIINNLMFKTFKINNGLRILLFLGALIPVAGLFIQLCYTICAYCVYPTCYFNSFDDVRIRDTMLNRWIFNDVDWKEYDKWKKKEIEKK